MEKLGVKEFLYTHKKVVSSIKCADIVNELNFYLRSQGNTSLEQLLLSSIKLERLKDENPADFNTISLDQYQIIVALIKFLKVYNINDSSIISYAINYLEYMKQIIEKEYKDFDLITKEIINNEKISEEDKIQFNEENILNTIKLLNEAVNMYMDIYHGKILKIHYEPNKRLGLDETTVEYAIKEHQLAHLLGVELKKIVSNRNLCDVLHINNSDIEQFMNYENEFKSGLISISILMKIIEMRDNLMEYEEDRIKKVMNSYNYKIHQIAKNNSSSSSLKPFNFKKINQKTRMFLSMKPYEEVTMALNLIKGENAFNQKDRYKDRKHTMIVSPNNLSELYSYSALVYNYNQEQNRGYFETLLAKTIENLRYFEDKSARMISSGVEIVSEDSGETVITKDFSEEQINKFSKKISEELGYYDMFTKSEFKSKGLSLTH